jgi:hypothetical protein
MTTFRNFDCKACKRNAALSGLGLLLAMTIAAPSRAQISAVWANDGADKVLQHELRASVAPQRSSVWNGSAVGIFGAKNEVVSFNMVLESVRGVSDVSVSFRELSGPAGFKIASRPAAGDQVFNYVGRDIELFYVRYLQVLGLSRMAYENYDERHAPRLMQRPFKVTATNRTESTGVWKDRPGADKFFPDIAVPLELERTFAIEASKNQSIWVDVYIPKAAPPGSYTGELQIRVAGGLFRAVPVRLDVLNFMLPDQPTSRTMVPIDPYDIAERYTGKRFPDRGNPEYAAAVLARDRHFMLARRHRITFAGGEHPDEARDGVAPASERYESKLRGTFFTEVNGYDGPGKGTPLDLFIIGTYGSATWTRKDTATVHRNANAWEEYFRKNFPQVERFIYDVDEPDLSNEKLVAEINERLKRYKSNPGIGRELKIFTTAYIDKASTTTPGYDIVAQWTSVANTPVIQRYADEFRRKGGTLYEYNGKRPGTGSFATDDDGTALRMVPWAQYKLGLGRHFYYLANYYYDYQTSGKQTNVWRSARTYGVDDRFDPIVGRTGFNYSNGDGVLVYPGRDVLFPRDTYDVLGPIASLRLKHWRRGIQDIEYVVQARLKDPARVDALVQKMVPRVFWEVGVEEVSDPTWKLGGVSWSEDAEVWEAARRELADIIADGKTTQTRPPAPKNLVVK